MSEEYRNAPSSIQGNSDSEPLPYTDIDLPLPYLETPSSSSNEPRQFLEPPPVPPTPAPPTEIDRLADKYRLGEVLKRYKSEPTAFTTDDFPSSSHMYVPGNRRSASASMLVPMIFGITLILWFATRTPPWPLILICLVFLAPWLGNIFNRLPKDTMVSLQNTEFYLCVNGLMIIRWTRVQAIRWERIRAVRQNRTGDIRRYSYTLYLDEGKPVTLDRSLVGPELGELAYAIEREVSQRFLPDAIAAYEEGQTLNFGIISVTPQGLQLENEHQCLPWERFASIEDYNGYLLTIKEGKFASTWQKIEVAGILNLCVFLPLVRHIKDNLRTSAPVSVVEEDAMSQQPLMLLPEWSVYEDDTL